MVYARQAVQGLPAEKPQERRLDVRGVASRQEAREPGNGRARGAARAGRRLMSAAEIDDYLDRLPQHDRRSNRQRRYATPAILENLHGRLLVPTASFNCSSAVM